LCIEPNAALLCLDSAQQEGLFLYPEQCLNGRVLQTLPLRDITISLYVPTTIKSYDTIKVRIFSLGGNHLASLMVTRMQDDEFVLFRLRLPAADYDLVAEEAGKEGRIRINANSGRDPLHFVGQIGASLLKSSRGIYIGNITLPSGNGTNKIQLQEYRGKWVLLSFWAHESGPSVTIMFKQLSEFITRYQGWTNQFQVIAIHSSFDVTSLRDYLEKSAPLKLDRRLAGVPIIQAIDEEAKLANTWEIEYRPTCVLIDPLGRLADSGNATAMLKYLRKSLRSNPGQVSNPGTP
jgi:peroxiredoxin